MQFKVTVNLERVSGPEQDADTMLDAFAAATGRDNTAKPPLTLTVGESVYIVSRIDD